MFFNKSNSKDPVQDKTKDTKDPVPGKVKNTKDPIPDEAEDTKDPIPNEVKDTKDPIPDEAEDTKDPIPDEVEDTKKATSVENSKKVAAATPLTKFIGFFSKSEPPAWMLFPQLFNSEKSVTTKISLMHGDVDIHIINVDLPG